MASQPSKSAAPAGARVVAAASTQEKVDLALSRGAATGFVYPTGADASDGRKLAQVFKQGCGPQGADVICDAVGDVYAEPAIRAIAWGGRYLVIGFAGGRFPRLPLNLPLLKGCDVMGVLYGAHVQRDPAAARVEIEELLTLYRDGESVRTSRAVIHSPTGALRLQRSPHAGHWANWSSFAVPQTVSEGGNAPGWPFSGTRLGHRVPAGSRYATAFVDRQILALLVEP